MDNICFVSVCFGEKYKEQQERLHSSIMAFHPEADTYFMSGVLPGKSKPWLESLYGFKPHAIQEARDKGFTKIVWVDTAMVLESRIDHLFKHKLVAAKDDGLLSRVISNKCLNFYGLAKEYMDKEDWHLVGGSFYVFDFNEKSVQDVFNTWKKAEENGLFGSAQEEASEQLQGHRHDETCMALAMYIHGIKPQKHDEIGYCCENGVVTKKHFK